MKRFIQFLESISPISDGCKTDLASIADQQIISKMCVFIETESWVDKEVFLSEGIVRAFLTDEQGNNYSTAFYEAPAFVSVSGMRSKKGHSTYNYEALSNSKLITFDSHAFRLLIDKYPELMTIAKSVKEEENARLKHREECMIQRTSLAKYLHFLKRYPMLEFSIPHYHLASFLGITPVTLSRIRGGKLKKRFH